MKPLDARLLTHARAARRFIVGTAALGVLLTGCIVAQALLISAIISPTITTGTGLDLRLLGWLGAVVVFRTGCVWLQDRFAHRSAQNVITELRERLVAHAMALGGRWLGGERGPALVTLATRSLEDLQPYFVRYLPQLLMAAIATPASLIVVFVLDWIAGLTLAITIPLIPIFMVLIGALTKSTANRRLAVMQRLGAQVLDLLAGLPTLRAFSRQHSPAGQVRSLGVAHRESTMATLKVAFLSGAVLELTATLSVALVAVSIGFRLLFGHVDLFTALAVIMLAPEVLQPLRQVGLHFHASTDGLAAAEAVFEVLDTPLPKSGTQPAPDLAKTTITLTNISVRTPGRMVAPSELTATIRPGHLVALAGSSGAGKSTAVAVLLGLLPPDKGAVHLACDGACFDLADLDLASYHSQITWVPQRAIIEPGRLRDIVAPDGLATTAELNAAAARTGFSPVVAEAAHGWDTVIGQGGAGLSVGQRQRLALTRALLADRPLVVLDEPTAHLDTDTEQVIINTVAGLRAAGRTVVLVAHRPSLLALADEVVTVTATAGVTAR